MRLQFLGDNFLPLLISPLKHLGFKLKSIFIAVSVFYEDLVSFPNVPCGTSGKKIKQTTTTKKTPASAENITDVGGSEPWVEKIPCRRE